MRCTFSFVIFRFCDRFTSKIVSILPPLTNTSTNATTTYQQHSLTHARRTCRLRTSPPRGRSTTMICANFIQIPISRSVAVSTCENGGFANSNLCKLQRRCGLRLSVCVRRCVCVCVCVCLTPLSCKRTKTYHSWNSITLTVTVTLTLTLTLALSH